MIKRTTGQKTFTVINSLFMILFMAICLYPILYVIFASFSSSTLLITHEGPLFFPKGFTLEAYEAIFSNNVIINGYVNTLFILVVGTSINLAMTVLAAYVLSSKDVYWKSHIMIFIILTMYFQGGLIPTYLNIRRLGLYDTIWSLIIPVSINTFNLIIMRTSFLTIPDSLIESADLDGASDITKLMHIVVPLSGPVIAVILLYYGVAHWNSWFTATIYIRSKHMQPLQVVLREILILNETSAMEGTDMGFNISETIKYATIVVATLPILIIYPLLQKYFVKGVMVGAIKG